MYKVCHCQISNYYIQAILLICKVCEMFTFSDVSILLWETEVLCVFLPYRMFSMSFVLAQVLLTALIWIVLSVLVHCVSPKVLWKSYVPKYDIFFQFPLSRRLHFRPSIPCALTQESFLINSHLINSHRRRLYHVERASQRR